VLLWSFSASAPILNAPVVAIANGVTSAIYVADRGGFIFEVDSNGHPVAGFNFSGPGGGPVGPMQSSPALAGDRLYVGSDDGNLYAVDATSGAVVWAFAPGGPIVSSPAVATGGTDPVIVVGSNDGNVYFVLDAGSAPSQMAVFPIGAPVRSSPAIDANGIVYVGADDGRLYAIH
jgi:outer membrane protein assembly factor BamB